jgi:hypothetical protein
MLFDINTYTQMKPKDFTELNLGGGCKTNFIETLEAVRLILPCMTSIQLLDLSDHGEMFFERFEVVKALLPKQMPSLHTLKLYGNHLLSIPEEIREFSSVEVLDLGNNKIELIPDWIEELTNLKELRLFKNSIGLINPKIGGLLQLEYLDICSPNDDSARIRTLPKEISKCKKLKFLDLSIEILPEWIGELNSLIYLSLRGGSLEKIPNSIGKLVNLERLDISYNKLRSIPDDIIGIKSLKAYHVNWEGNPMPEFGYFS